MNYQRKPDLLTMVVLVVGAGVLLTTVAQADDNIPALNYSYCATGCDGTALPERLGLTDATAATASKRSLNFERYRHARSLTQAKRSWGLVRRSDVVDVALTLDEPGLELSRDMGRFRTGIRLDTEVAGYGDTALMIGFERSW